MTDAITNVAMATLSAQVIFEPPSLHQLMNKLILLLLGLNNHYWLHLTNFNALAAK